MIMRDKIPERTHAGVMEEQMRQIPVYSGEWTNYNPSDPGITILENLNAFQLLQREKLNGMTDSMRSALLRLAGCERRKEEPAGVFLETDRREEAVDIPKGQRFWAGGICFETQSRCELPAGGIVSLFLKHNGSFHRLDGAPDQGENTGVAVFTERPAAGMELYLVMDKAPAPGKECSVYAQIPENERRNPFRAEREPVFAEIGWQLYTQSGFLAVTAWDETRGFLTSGRLRFLMPEQKAALFKEGPVSGFVVRGRLERADYDIPPKLRRLSGYLIAAKQQETAAGVFTFRNTEDAVLETALAEEGFLRVFVREEGEGFFRACKEGNSGKDTGRYYNKEKISFGKYSFRFGTNTETAAAPLEVKIVVYGGMMMRSCNLGLLAGWDDQEFALPGGRVAEGTLSLLAEWTEGEEKAYQFFQPDGQTEGGLQYEVETETGKLTVKDAGAYAGAKLYVASCAFTKGAAGNVVADNIFTPEGLWEGAAFSNPAEASGGRDPEQLWQTQKRYAAQLTARRTAVTAIDYERKALACPGLCIHKVHAWANAAENRILLTVKPNTEEAFPELSGLYRNTLEKWLNEDRLLSVRVAVRPPVYAAVSVRGVFCVRRHYGNSRESIREAIIKCVDYRIGEQSFGSLLRLDALYAVLAALPCMAQIRELRIMPQNTGKARRVGEDIAPDENCLLYPGEIRISLTQPEDFGGI